VLATGLAWSSVHGGEGMVRLSDEAVMITGDGNLVELQATVRYRVSDPRVYLFEVAEPDAIVRSQTEAVLREVVGGRSFVELLTTNREQFQHDVLARLRQRCPETGPGSLGIRVEGVSLHDLHPPQEVVQAYHDVTKAMEARDRIINEAGADALRKERVSEAQALQIRRQAEATRVERVRQAEGSQAAFLARHSARARLTRGQEARLLADAFAAAVQGQPAEDAYRDYAARRAELVRAQQAVMDFRLFWDTLGQSLTGREKVIIDAEKLPGRRHLFLVDPDQFRVPVPMLSPYDRGPPRSRLDGQREEP
jgi:regulator of protease activity HflC (stomatin/prohibitin superfamily)